ncbi:MAG: radical SAM protein [Myxococcota bacterium]|nr:radical SAM protein [Myxococcota bacterium]
MVDSLTVGPLVGGGLVLGYACPSMCRHCLYACGPHRKDGKPTLRELEGILDLLAERAPNARYHIGGGEPLLDRALLRRAIMGMRDRGLSLEYVETNAAWVSSPQQAVEVLAELESIGLRCVLVSVSPFHAEHIPFQKTRTLIEAARRVLPSGAFVWIQEFVPDILTQPEDQPLNFEALVDERGDPYALSLALRYGLVPGGRAGRYFEHYGRRLGWKDAARNAPCSNRLIDTSHFHVDGQARYVPGLCAGIVLPLEVLPGQVNLKAYPVIRTLLERDGLEKLVLQAMHLGFEPKEHYSAPCDLCTHVRLHLYKNRPTADLGPEGFYDPRSLVGFKG